MVEGAHFGAARKNVGEHRVQVPKHFNGRNTHDLKAVPPKPRITRSVSPRLFSETVSLAVHLHDQSMTEAGKVRGDTVRWKLTPKLEASRSLSELLPQQHLRQAHLFPQQPRALDLLDRCLEDAWAPSTTPA